MKYIVYLTTNLKSQVNGLNRIYIGVHKTENPDIFDGYLGCGVWANQPSTYKYPKTPIQYAIKKYGVKAFKRQILYIFDTMKEAYNKEAEIVDINFIKLSHVYNVCVGGIGGYAGKPLYQFDLQGNLIKIWEYGIEAYEFYGISRKQFNYAIHGRHPLLNSFWSRENTIRTSDYITTKHRQPKITYLYNQDGKCIDEFNSRKECAKFIGCNEAAICKAVEHQRLVNKQFYVSDKLIDLFIPKPRKQYTKTTFYIYQSDPFKYIGTGIGKEIMSIIDCYSWKTLRDSLRYKKGWYKNFYISEEQIVSLPKKPSRGIKVDIYDKYGNFIETLDTIKKVKNKYKINASKIKNIQLGDKYIENYIFKYHSK